MRALILAVVLVLSASQLGVAQTKEASASSSGGAAAGAQRVLGTKILPDGSVETTFADGSKEVHTVSAAGLEPPPLPEWLRDADTNARFLASMRSYYEYRTSGFDHRRLVFEWQLLSSKVIFATVLMLVGAGMVFAAIQFRVGLRRSASAPPDGAPADAVTQIEFAATSVKVTSPVLGVVILMISLAFFYLYLVYVYPIKEII